MTLPDGPFQREPLSNANGGFGMALSAIVAAPVVVAANPAASNIFANLTFNMRRAGMRARVGFRCNISSDSATGTCTFDVMLNGAAVGGTGSNWAAPVITAVSHYYTEWVIDFGTAIAGNNTFNIRCTGGVGNTTIAAPNVQGAPQMWVYADALFAQ
jgi:hypothetical protein